ncbi:MAG TPA: Gfo/Idh/MocA family oxidoreductase [Gemmatimonadaceae bacterium]
MTQRTGRYSAALVGCGKIGSLFADDPLMRGDVFSHAEAYTVCPDTNLIAIVDPRIRALEKCGKRWGVARQFLHAKEMMASVNPDIVSVATPTETHAWICREVITAERPPRAILCEKPIASTLEEAQQIVALAREKGVVLVVMHMRRYANNMRRLRDFLKSGGIGELRNVSGWLTKGTVHNGTHWFDLLRYLVGEVRWVHGINSLCEDSDDPTLDVAMQLTNGMLATMRAAEHANFTICEMDIMGTKGRAQIVDSSYQVNISIAEPSARYTGYVELSRLPVDMGDRKDVMLHAVEDIVHCLDTGDTPQSTGEDGVAALRIALAAHESSRTGEVVELN